jgi:hypothetical protein
MIFSRFFKITLLISILFGTFFVANYIYRAKEMESYEKFYKEQEKLALDVLKPQWDQVDPDPNLKQERIKVLVIEGGGAKGLYALRVLNYLEKKTGKPISQLYDVMGGTSIGSLLVSILSVPKEGEVSKPKYSAEEVLSVFSEVAQRTLEPSWKQKILSGFGLLSPILQNQKFIKELQSVYGNMLFSDAINHLILYGYNFSTTKIIPFHNRGVALETADPVLYQLIGGTTSPFGIAPPNKVLLSPLYAPQFIGDAALVINNPLGAMIFELTRLYPNKKFLINYIVISPKEIQDTANFPYYSGWIKAVSMFKILMNQAQNQQIREAMRSLSNIYKFDLMLEIGLEQNSEWVDINSFDFSKKNLEKIDNFAKLILNENKEQLDLVAKELLKD